MALSSSSPPAAGRCCSLWQRLPGRPAFAVVARPAPGQADTMADRLLADQVALVTGAASGIGRATALRLAAEGARLAVADRDLEGLRAAAAEIGAGALAVGLDVTSESDWDAATKTIEARWGRLDIAVLAAGISHAAPVDTTTLEDWRRVMAVNADGCFLGLRAAVRMF